MSDRQRQEDEMEVLESIYDKDLRISSRWPSSGCIHISPDPLTEDFSMNVVRLLNEQTFEKTIKLRYLAPIELYFKCPDDYPSKSQPLFMLKCIWLSDQALSTICQNLDSIWDRKRSEILYDWAYSVKDCCSSLNIERLDFTVGVDDECNINNDVLDLKLKELKNKHRENENKKESYGDERLRRRKFCRRRKLLDSNFKYETPGDTKITDEGNDSRCSKENSLDGGSYASSQPPQPSSMYEYLLTMLPRYGVRRKTLFNDRDSRIIPNFEEIKPDKHGVRGTSRIVQEMIDYNDECISRAFRHESHYCGICLEEKLGSASIRVQLCGHIYCRDCVSQYLSVNILTGNLRALLCPHIGCDTPFTVAQIRHTVDEATYKKFEDFKRRMTVEDDPNLLHCPRDMCQSIARRRPDLGNELCYCARCSFYFCMYCKRAYHGVQPCELQNEERLKVIREYLNADSVRQNELEKKYTKPLIRKWVDEHLSEKWIQTSSKPCPNCKVPIQKNDGCNKMLCFNCDIPFCWLCDECLSTVKPYDHFTNSNSPCYQQLFAFPIDEDLHFEGEEEEEEEDVLLYQFLIAAVYD